MTTNTDLIVFTDLDGTLIGHDTYKWGAAQQALTALSDISAGVILASSKTAPEVSALRTDLGLDGWPAIVENGAGLLPANVDAIESTTQYGELRRISDSIPTELRDLFRGFGDVTIDGVVEMTGLSHEAAALAKQRAFSEPGQWLGTDAQKSEFLERLTAHGVVAQQGGRFLTLSFGGNKVDQMRQIIETHHPKYTVALGDAPNDIEMLEHATFGVVIANPHRPPLPPLQGEAGGQIIRTTAAGPLGWNSAILDLLDRLELH